MEPQSLERGQSRRKAPQGQAVQELNVIDERSVTKVCGCVGVVGQPMLVPVALAGQYGLEERSRCRKVRNSEGVKCN